MNYPNYFCSVTVVILLLIASCRTQKEPLDNSAPSYIKKFLGLSSQEYDFSFKESSDGTKVLCVKNPLDRGKEIVYAVYSIKNGIQLFQSAIIGSGVEWYSDEELKLIGVSRLSGEELTLVNVNTGVSRKIRISKAK